MKVRLVAVSLIILVLSAIKTAFPEIVAAAKKSLQPVIRYTEDLAGDMLAVGKRLTGDGVVVYTWEKEEKPEESAKPAATVAPEGFDLNEMINANLAGFREATGSDFFPPENEDAFKSAALIINAPEGDTSERDALQERVDAFLERQAAVTALALPESVCVEALAVTFEHTRPVSGDTASVFGYRLHPIYNDIRFHYGADFTAFWGDAISAFADGTVISAGWFDGYGLSVIIDHGDGFTSLYAHCSALNVTLGERVAMGQTIALVGATGNVTGAHLHFELQKDGLYLNPEFYL